MSDGQAILADVIEAARTERIDAVIVTDHETLGHAMNGWAGPVLVVTGEEITPGYGERMDHLGRISAWSAGSHLVAIGIDHTVSSLGAPSQASVDAVAEQGGLSFIAHPEDADSPWEDWSVENVTGLEIWNFKTAWKRGLAHGPTQTYAWRNPDAVLRPPDEDVLARWDAIGAERRFVGISGSDNHASPYIIDGIERCLVPWYLGISALVNHIWVDAQHFDKDPVNALLAAIECGRLLMAHHGAAPARGFTTQVQPTHRSGAAHWPGDEFSFTDDLLLTICSPREAVLRVIRDGQQVSEKEAESLELPIDQSGVWRVEAWLDERAWVFSNPFYIRDPSDHLIP
jgi:hypothetical protein